MKKNKTSKLNGMQIQFTLQSSINIVSDGKRSMGAYLVNPLSFIKPLVQLGFPTVLQKL